MIKKIDTLILKAFVGPFLATLFISIFVLVMQFFWLYIDDLVGKGIDLLTIAELIAYVSVSILPMALPLSLLLSSIMTLGNLGETFELVALKSAGISLLRFMRPLLFVAILLSIVAFFLSNNFIPVANLKLDRLKYDIIMAKPAFDIKEGTFYDKIDGFVIRVGQKAEDNKNIKDVLIFEKNYGLQDNLLVAKSGKMDITPDNQYLEFVLKDGWRYEETGNSGENDKTQMVRTGFKTYKKMFDMSSFQMGQTDEEGFKYSPKMLTITQLTPTIDSLERGDSAFSAFSRNEMSNYLGFVKYQDSAWTDYKGKTDKKDYLSAYPDSLKSIYFANNVSQINSLKSNTDFQTQDYLDKQSSLRSHKIEWHRKFTLSVACIILFMIGAPLGSIIRKGGLGMPLVFAIIFFVLFYILNTFGEKFARQGVLTAMEGMWLSSLILLPIGAFLTYKAMHDSQLFNKESYYRIFRSVRKFLNKIGLAKKVEKTS